MPLAASSFRDPVPPRRTLPCGAVMVCLLLAGCTGSQPESRPQALSVEPELPATASAGPQRRNFRRVPEVIARFKPFRATEAAVGRGVAPPANAAVELLPPAFVTGAGGVVRLASAEEPGHLPAADHAAAPLVAEIRDMLAGYLRAFNRHDAPALAAHWAAGGENVNLDSGEVTAGREAVQSVFEKLFAVDPEATIEIDVAAIRPLRGDVAVIDGVSRVAYADGGVASSRFSAVAARNGDRWQLESVRESATAQDAAPARPLDALAWLVGSWEDVGEGVTAGSRCDWSAGRGFLVRSHSLAPDTGRVDPPRAGDGAIPGLLPGGATPHRELTEIIGWDPERQEIRSWIFSSDGRFAEAGWSHAGEQWTIRVEGRGADVGRSATCTLLPAGPDGLEVRCEGGGLDGLLPPACGFTRTSR